jgi:4a-hydroxytetrahydrobiopterin dehydratase
VPEEIEPMEMLTPEALTAALAALPGWQTVEVKGARAIQKQYRFKDFVEAMAFVNRVAEQAEAAGHHPDIEISWNRVTLTLTTHDAGGLTARDIALARQLD